MRRARPGEPILGCGLRTRPSRGPAWTSFSKARRGHRSQSVTRVHARMTDRPEIVILSTNVRYTQEAARPCAEAVEALRAPSPTYSRGLSASGGLFRLAAASQRVRSYHMYATVRRYEGIDKVRSGEITMKA